MIFNYNQKTFLGMYQGKESGRKLLESKILPGALTASKNGNEIA